MLSGGRRRVSRMTPPERSRLSIGSLIRGIPAPAGAPCPAGTRVAPQAPQKAKLAGNPLAPQAGQSVS